MFAQFPKWVIQAKSLKTNENSSVKMFVPQVSLWAGNLIIHAYNYLIIPGDTETPKQSTQVSTNFETT